MASSYEHHYTAFGDQVLRAGFMQAAMRARAEVIKAAAEAIAPTGNAATTNWYKSQGRAPGEYRASFHVTGGVRQTGASRRAYGRVSNTSAHAHLIEYGYDGVKNGRRIHVPRYRVLGKSMGAAGGDVRSFDRASANA